MTQIIKIQPKEPIEKSIGQIDESDDGGVIIKSTSAVSDSQVQLVLTKLEANRFQDYFVQRHEIQKMQRG